jgi:hypothetical protein
MKLCDLNPSTAHIVRVLVLELAAYKRCYRTSRSQPVTLGSRSPVIINPDQGDTENNIEGKDDPNCFHKWPDRKLFGKKIAPTEKAVPL